MFSLHLISTILIQIRTGYANRNRFKQHCNRFYVHYENLKIFLQTYNPIFLKPMKLRKTVLKKTERNESCPWGIILSVTSCECHEQIQLKTNLKALAISPSLPNNLWFSFSTYTFFKLAHFHPRHSIYNRFSSIST